MARRFIPRFSFLLPLLFLGVTACDDDSATDPDPASVAEVVAETPELGTLAGLLDDAGLASTLESGGPFTLFAPTDNAFQALPDEVLNAVLADPMLLEEVLLNHVVSGTAEASSLSDGQMLSTLSGGTLTVSIAGTTVRIEDATVVEADVEASNGVIHIVDAVLVPEQPEPDLVDVAVDAGFSTLVAAVQDAGLEETLRGEGPFTVFAPTNDAFDGLPDGTLAALLDDPEALAEVLLYHVVPGRVLAEDLVDGQLVTTAEGRVFRITLPGGGPEVNGASIVQTDVEASNGVIHVIDAVLIPVEDNVDTAIEAGFETLVAAVQAAELEGVLRGDGPFTIFAPTDDAFDALPDGTLDDLLADPEALATILTYHVVEGRIFSSDLEDGTQVTTVEGRTVTISLNGGAQVNEANITGVDVLTSNGVIHVIDAVLIPEE